jgi:hypothetical protein
MKVFRPALFKIGRLVIVSATAVGGLSKPLTVAAVLVVLGSATPAARAGFIGVSGQGNIINPALGGATANFFQDPGHNVLVHGWEEAQNFTLQKDIYVDINHSGTFDSNSDLDGFHADTIAAGTVVSSQLLYFDPKESDAVERVTFTFDAPILGVIVESDRFFNKAHNDTDYFMDTDFLINPLTPSGNYPTAHFNNRGLELGSPDKLTVSFAENTVTFDMLRADSPGDQVRVITAATAAPAATAVPEPTTLVSALIGMGLTGAFSVRRLARRQAANESAA